MDTKTAQESIIAQGTSCKGTVTSECPITVSGVVEGELTAPTLVVADSGSVHGRVLVERLTSSGEISGDIDADTMELAGKVRDNTSIRAKSLEVRLSGDGSDKLSLVFGTAALEVGADAGQGPGSGGPDAAE